MKLSDLDYELPADLIAQRPLREREASRMLLVDRSHRRFRDDEFINFPDRLRRGDVLVLNNTKVFAARLVGVSETGARAETFLVRNISGAVWEALCRPARRLPVGKRVTFGEELRGTIVEALGEGRVSIELEFTGDLFELLDRVGRTPLPPYIKRPTEGERDADRERYQTVYARSSGAIAAPTAGLHFSGAVLDNIRAMGVEIVEVTLHVGYGTFEPVRARDLSQHTVLPEQYEIDGRAANLLNAARVDGRRIVAVGTTTTRALESAIARHGEFAAGPGLAEITVTPGFEFRAVSALLTNFHLPQSSLLILVSTFAGHELIMDAYRHAVAQRYRFFSYGDCMLIE